MKRHCLHVLAGLLVSGAASAEAGLTGPRGPDVFPLHLSAAEAAQIAEEAGAERLVLTHVASTKSSREVHDEAAAVFSGETIVAAPGLQLEV